ncbi:telomerase Cajal body protein 1-like [Oscarella lobularis]|uniref:telomerase Cajal body protein 1-like n=1 Tax=Oscarella lobularis TaxID=121494 RepID=UPI003313D2EE
MDDDDTAAATAVDSDALPATIWNWNDKPRMVVQQADEFKNDNFLKGCKWSPDGLCLMTCSNDSRIRLFNLPYQLHPSYTKEDSKNETTASLDCVLQMREPEGIYDYNWYPSMNSSCPETCCLICTSKDQPIHLWDAYNGSLRASYCAFNHLDEVISAYSLGFTPDANRVYAGYRGEIRIFDVARPGRASKHQNTKGVQRGIISCFGFPTDFRDLYAAGSYDRSIGLYSDSDGSHICSLLGHSGGVTHLLFSNDGNRLYSGGRKDNELLCWDIRQPGEVLFRTERAVETNQRIYFDLDRGGDWLVSGQQCGKVRVWKVGSDEDFKADQVALPYFEFDSHLSAVNGVSLHPYLPLLATASGQRVFKDFGDSDSENDGEFTSPDNSLKIWSIK